MTIEILIPIYYNDPSLFPVIQRCLDSLGEYYPDLPVRLLDDGSPLDTSHWPIWRRSEENKGYVATVNELLRSSKAKVMVVANDDLTFKAGELDWALHLDGLTIASPRDTASSPDDRFGAIFALTEGVVEKIGYFNEKYRNYMADLDYYHRAKAAGVQIVKINDVIIDHVESATFKTLDKNGLFKDDSEAYWKVNGNLLPESERSGN